MLFASIYLISFEKICGTKHREFDICLDTDGQVSGAIVTGQVYHLFMFAEPYLTSPMF